MQAGGKRSSQSSSKKKAGKNSDRTRKGPPDTTGVVGRQGQLDEDDDDDDNPPINLRRGRQFVLDEEDTRSEAEEDDDEGERMPRAKVNSAATKTRPPLAPRNQHPESEQETSQNEELQEKYQKVREALRASQMEVAQLKQTGKERRKRSGDEDNRPDHSKKQKTRTKGETEDRESRARDLGKRFALECVLWVDSRVVFAESDSRGGDGHEEDNDAAGDDDDEAVATQRSLAPLAEPANGWALKTSEGIDNYTRFQVRRFKRMLEPKDLRNWGRKWFKKEFCEGARKFRSDILKGLANRPIEVFDLKNVTAVQFMDKNGRSGLPEVRELLKNETFLLGDNPAGGLHTERLYRNECIVKILLRVYAGPEAVITGTRSRMAHKTYGSKYKPESVTFVQLALAAIVAKVILEGDAEFTDANTDRVDWYWKRLDFLYQIKSKKPQYVDATIKYLNKRLGFGTEEEAEEFNELEETMLAELEDD